MGKFGPRNILLSCGANDIFNCLGMIHKYDEPMDREKLADSICCIFLHYAAKKTADSKPDLIVIFKGYIY